MKVLVTGATGFVGRHVVAELVTAGHEVFAVVRHQSSLSDMPWRDAVQFLVCDIHGEDVSHALAFTPDVLVHLAWSGLPNYHQAFHFERNLPADYRFLKRAAECDVGQILVAGTGAEFGMVGGALAEEAATAPVTAYGIAKDSLRRFLLHLQLSRPFVLQWVRLFHMHGPGQSPGSLLAQLDKAIDEKAEVFDMSGGEQLRDYLPVQEVARRISLLVCRPDIQGAINCCSGNPISVRRLVENRINECGATIRLNLGVHPYLDYEPMAYWGSIGKIAGLLKGKQ